MPNASDQRFVSLAGGLTLPVEPVTLVLNLEARGLTLRRDHDDVLVSPASKLTDDERTQLKRWKQHVLAVLDYEAPRVA